jgi:hypothetical protein
VMMRGWWARASARSRLAAALFWEPFALLILVIDLRAISHGSADYFAWVSVLPAVFVSFWFPAQILRAVRDIRRERNS